MPPLTIVSSVRPDALIAQLALDLSQAKLDPFAQETIIVQSRGTERWIRHELARRQGCAASLHFPFAASFFRALARALDTPPDAATGQLPADAIARAAAMHPSDTIAREALTWRILGLLENGLSSEPSFEPLRSFIGTPELHDARKMLGLARTLASRFEEYELYRPDLLLAWQTADALTSPTSESERWQAALWRRLCDTQATECDTARLYLEAVTRLQGAGLSPANPLQRLSLFGVNTLPPVFVDMILAVARHIPVRLYLQLPPRESWASSARNPLFASFGGVVREFVTLLEQKANTRAPLAWAELDSGAREGANETSILARLQADVRTGTCRSAESGSASPIALRTDNVDESLALHRCHSPMREMEVLRDQLLAAFAADPTLRPHDVILLLPDVTTYAPFVEAVFGVGEAGLPYIPHRIADRTTVQESGLADAALRILRLVGARWTATEIVALLDLPSLRRSAGLSNGSSAQILAWIEETRIRWGRDGAMRHENFDLPPVETNSWRAGLDRLLMGYATGQTSDLVADVLPCAGDTIGDPATLGAFSWFIERLFDTLTDWRTARSLGDWSAALRSAFETLLTPDDDEEERELEAVLAAVDELASMDAGQDEARAVDLPVVRDWLEQMLAADAKSSGFLSGGMTVCALQPMRVVPHRIVAIAGLDDASFPRGQNRSAFDLVAAAPRVGDRDRRADDRQLFLDTVLAAQERLILTCVARSAKTNVERATSVVVAELMDVVDRSFRISGRKAHELLEVDHRLQPFSPAYFTGDATSRLFSYSAVNARALAAVGDGPHSTAAEPFVIGPLETPNADAEQREIRLEDLIACWSNPSRFFCTRALDIRLAGECAPMEECEPMTVNQLDRYHVQDLMLQRHLAGGRALERERVEAVALGNLPSGVLGGLWFDKLDDELRALLASVGTPTFEDPAPVHVSGASWTLTGQIEGITGTGRLQVRPARCKSKDRIRAWITHLALTAAFGPTTTELVANDGRWTFGEVADAMGVLDTLVEGYRATWHEPIPFFGDASYRYADQAFAFEQAAASGGSSRRTKSPIDAAHDGYEGSEFGDWSPGDRADVYVALCWRGRDPLAEASQAREAFERWSMAFWRPALDVMKEEKGNA